MICDSGGARALANAWQQAAELVGGRLRRRGLEREDVTFVAIDRLVLEDREQLGQRLDGHEVVEHEVRKRLRGPPRLRELVLIAPGGPRRHIAEICTRSGAGQATFPTPRRTPFDRSSAMRPSATPLRAARA